MDIYKEIDLQDCPICHGTGVLEEETGWCIYVACVDCGSHTAELPYKNETERVQMAKQAASTWNMGKVIASSPGE